MIRNKMNYSAITFAIMAMAAFAGSANAAVATANVPINMGVAAAGCTVANSNTSITLAPATSPSMTVQSYLTTNGITTPAQLANSVTSAALNQTATISCSVASTPITSIDVTPGTNAKLVPGYTALQQLVDQSPTPVAAGGGSGAGAFQWMAELVSVNGASTPYSFDNGGNIQPYTTQFSTGVMSGSTSTATFVWRPITFAGTPGAAIGNPTGGTYSGMYQIVVNY